MTKMTYKTISIFGKVPHIILVEDGMDKDGKSIPEKDFIVSDTVLGIYASIYFKKHINQHTVPYQKFKAPFEDFKGELTYSTFNIVIGGKNAVTIESINTKDKNSSLVNILIDLTTRLINVFLTAYKINTKKHWIPELNRVNLSPYSIEIYDSNCQTLFKQDIDLRGTGIPYSANISNETLNLIKKSCWKTYSVDETYKFLLKSNRYKQTGDYISFVLYLAFYIERWINREIIYVFKKMNKREEEIQSFFLSKKGYPKSLIKILEDFIENKDDFQKLTDSKEYQNYRSELVERRNNIAHGIYLEINKRQSERIVSAAMDYRDFLRSTFINLNFKTRK